MSTTKLPTRTEVQPVAHEVLRYLEHRMPSYPFDAAVDREFVEELVNDFPQVEILEEVKAFRWYYNNAPQDRMRQVRLGLRRWLARARAPKRARS